MKLLLVDDHGLFRGGLRLLLASLQRDLEILEAESCREALDTLQQHSDIRLCLVDLKLPDETGMSVITMLKTSKPEVMTVVISADETRQAMRNALDAGAAGYVPKSASPEVMVKALQLVLGGGIYLPDSLLQQEQSLANEVANTQIINLTERQLQVLQCLLRGMPNKRIGQQLHISENTLKGHLNAIYRALEVNSRTQAVIEAGKRGLKIDLGNTLQ